MLETLRGVVVGHTDVGETDRVVRLLTAEEGRTGIFVFGARASKKRYPGAFDLGNQVRVHGTKGRGGLFRLRSVDPVAAPVQARLDLDRIALLAYGCEIVSKLAGEHQPAPRLTRLLIVWLTLLEGDAAPGIASRQALEAKALAFSGHLPNLRLCAVCGAPLTGDSVCFSLESGALHRSCGPGKALSYRSLCILDHLLRTPLLETVRMDPSDSAWILCDVIQYVLCSPVQSRALLQSIALM